MSETAAPRILSLWEPWASSLADPDGPKTNETRGYSTPYRGPVIILSSLHRLTRAERAQLPEPVLDHYLDGEATFRRGHALAVADLAEVVPSSSIVWHPAFFNRARRDPRDRAWWPETEATEGGGSAPTGRLFVHPDEEPWGLYGPGRFAWLFERIRPLPEPIPAKGAQGPRVAPTDLVAAIEDQLGPLS